MVLDAYLLNTQHYKVRNKRKWSIPSKGIAASPTPGGVAIEKRTFG